MRRLGRLVGYALLGLVDALVPAVFAAVFVHGITIYLSWPQEYLIPVAVAGLVLVIGFVIGAAAASQGGKPFPVTRTTLRVWNRLWWV